MDKPKCRLCGKKHWGDCEWVEIPIPEGGVTQKVKHKNPEEKFDRTAYQREYMRKRRAKKK